MLEFEEEQVPVKAEVSAPAGFVVIPIEEYNNLLLDAHSRPFIKVKKSIFSKDKLDVEIDSDWLYYTAVELMKLRYTPEELAQFDMVPVDSVYVSDVTIATRKPPKPQEPDEDLAPGAETL